MLVQVFFARNKTQQNVLPQTIGLAPLETQHKGSSLLVVRVLPDRLHVLLEQVQVRPDLHVGRSFEVLVVGPEVFNSGDVCDWPQAVLVVIFSLDELLIPELQGLLQGLRGILLLHNIQSKNYGVKWDI